MHTVYHTIDPFFYPDSKVLLLGSMPSPKSRESGFPYGHKQNRFWKVISAVLGEDEPQSIEQKKAMLKKHKIALWDVIRQCDIEGAADSSITNVIPNDISYIIKNADIRAVFCTGSKSHELYVKHCEKDTNMKAIKLPSTSPANCAFSFGKLLSSYSIVARVLNGQ